VRLMCEVVLCVDKKNAQNAWNRVCANISFEL